MPPTRLTRRGFINTLGVGIALSGCLAPTAFDPDVEPVRRLGGADQVSMNVSPEEAYSETDSASFEEWATRRANTHAVRRLRSLLADAGLTGEGVSIGQAAVSLDELEHAEDAAKPSESEFERAVNIGPRVFHFHRYSREGELLSEPTVPFRSIVAETPRSFEVTVQHAGERYVAVLPVMCERGWIRNE